MAAHAHSADSPHREGYDFAHPLPVWGLALVFVILTFLTVVTVAQASFDLGNWDIALTMLIATIKATLVMLFFMHLAFDKPFNLIIFVLAIYVGYHVVWNVTPALHTPLMAVTNAISAIVIVGAMLAAALTETVLGMTMGVLAVALAAVNVFGGFLVTRRMLEMFKKKDKKTTVTKEAA
jgi:NAD(P) transhydrogenase subunit alpha